MDRHPGTQLASASATDPPVAELLQRAASGDRAAWNALVDHFGGLVWSVARSFRLDQASAADVSQTTWLRLVEHIDRIRQPERLAGWLATTARNEALRLLRHERRCVPTDSVQDVVDPAGTDPATRLVRSEEAASVAEALESLPHDCQQLLRLCTADPPLSFEEIAEILGRPVGSIGPTRARCLEKLRRRLAAVDHVAARC